MKILFLKQLLLAAFLANYSASVVAAEKKVSGHDHTESEKHKPAADDGDHKGEKQKHDEAGVGHKKPGHKEEEGDNGAVKLDDAKIREAGIRAMVLKARLVGNIFLVPGEIKANAYRSALVTPRINSIVMSRQALLGDHVLKGKLLVTLFSVEMSSAQSKFIISDREWQRVKQLGEDVVSARRFLGAKVKRQEDYSRLKAYGMTNVQIAKLGDESAINKPGEFQLSAPVAGTIAADDFKVGQLIEPGKPLFEIIDETRVWAEARLDLQTAAQIKIGSEAHVLVGDRRIPGVVRQMHRKLDEHTRTLGIRIVVPNEDSALRPGQFISVELSNNSGKPELAVPQAAILRSSDGDWTVFVEHKKGTFKPVEIEIVRKAGRLSVIKGLPSGTRVVVAGAFFLQSELAKSGFSIHNH
jgi:membrane fusion protein, heavy metal efflux system